MNKLSVIIPAFNAEFYLYETFDSLKRQKWDGEIETILIDDGSTDRTKELGEKLADIVIVNQHAGAAKARNAGIRRAGGDWILLLDADDLLDDCALQVLYKPFMEDAGIQAVFAKAEDFISPELTAEQKAGLRPRKGPYSGMLTGCALLRKSVFDQVGLFDESLTVGETVAWQMQLREMKIPVISLDTLVLHRRLHMTNTGRLFQKQEMQSYAAILRKRMKKQ